VVGAEESARVEDIERVVLFVINADADAVLQ